MSQDPNTSDNVRATNGKFRFEKKFIDRATNTNVGRIVLQNRVKAGGDIRLQFKVRYTPNFALMPNQRIAFIQMVGLHTLHSKYSRAEGESNKPLVVVSCKEISMNRFVINTTPPEETNLPLVFNNSHSMYLHADVNAKMGYPIYMIDKNINPLKTKIGDIRLRDKPDDLNIATPNNPTAILTDQPSLPIPQIQIDRRDPLFLEIVKSKQIHYEEDGFRIIEYQITPELYKHFVKIFNEMFVNETVMPFETVAVLLTRGSDEIHLLDSCLWGIKKKYGKKAPYEPIGPGAIGCPTGEFMHMLMAWNYSTYKWKDKPKKSYKVKKIFKRGVVYVSNKTPSRQIRPCLIGSNFKKLLKPR